MDTRGTRPSPHPAPRTHRAATRIPAGSPRPCPLEARRVRPLHQRRSLLRPPTGHRWRRRLQPRHACPKMFLRRGRIHPRPTAPLARTLQSTLVNPPRIPRRSPRHPAPHPRCMQTTRNPLRRPTPKRRLPLCQRSPTNNRRRNPRHSQPRKALQGNGKRIPQGKRGLLDPRFKPETGYRLPRRKWPRRPLRLLPAANPQRRNRLRIHRRRNPRHPNLDRSMEANPYPLRIRRRQHRGSMRQSPRQTRSKSRTLPTQRRKRLERNHPAQGSSTISFNKSIKLYDQYSIHYRERAHGHERSRASQPRESWRLGSGAGGNVGIRSRQGSV